MLSLICCKDSYSPDDRNSIRRILLTRFDEWLVEGVKNEQFYNYVKYPGLYVGLSVRGSRRRCSWTAIANTFGCCFREGFASKIPNKWR